jgi:hypothetical protein
MITCDHELTFLLIFNEATIDIIISIVGGKSIFLLTSINIKDNSIKMDLRKIGCGYLLTD